jgi:hypothetical protein
MNYRKLLFLKLTLARFILFPLIVEAQSSAEDKSKQSDGQITLVVAALCEDIQGNLPINPTTVFSIERRKAFCFTSFDPVPQKTVIYHHWFHRDRPSAKIKLTLKPPRWSSYSSIQLRVDDIGPWRVEIVDFEGQIIHILRFSITE